MLIKMEEKKEKRLKELEEFAKEIKRTIRNFGRSDIPKNAFEELFVKYKINIGESE